MADQPVSIDVSGAAGGAVSGLRTRPSGAAPRLCFVYAPGAGSNLRDPFGAFLARTLAAVGIESLRFQFPYMEAGRPGPDRALLLEATWRAAIDAAGPAASTAVGGRSMGGRIASQVVAQGASVKALVLFAYPLHPPKRPEQARDAHLPSITVPTLFCSGTRDAFASPEELEEAADKVKASKVHLLDGADHGFNALKSSGRTREAVWAEAVEASLSFLGALEC